MRVRNIITKCVPIIYYILQYLQLTVERAQGLADIIANGCELIICSLRPEFNPQKELIKAKIILQGSSLMKVNVLFSQLYPIRPFHVFDILLGWLTLLTGLVSID